MVYDKTSYYRGYYFDNKSGFKCSYQNLLYTVKLIWKDYLTQKPNARKNR